MSSALSPSRHPSDPSFSDVMVFAPVLENVAAARRFVTASCRSAGVPSEVCDMAVLLSSEVVTNAFIHGRSDARVRIASTGVCVHVEVEDENSRYPHIQSLDLDALDGRGLQILDVAASSWGVRPGDLGKVVWFAVGCVNGHRM